MKKFIANLKLPAASSGLTLIELIIVVTMISIILTMAVSGYSTYSIRSKVGESLYAAASARHSIESACQADTTLTSLSNQATGYKFKATEYTSNIKIGGVCDEPKITITTRATGAQPDPVLTITGDPTGDSGQMTWICVSNGLNSHVPESCRSGQERSR
jgi:type IV pilus assembly protein PilA